MSNILSPLAAVFDPGGSEGWLQPAVTRANRTILISLFIKTLR
jgi:hypothetical protein